MSESAPESLPIAESASPVLTSGLPFAFAQSRNVLLERSGAALTLHYVRRWRQTYYSRCDVTWERYSHWRHSMRTSSVSDSLWPISAPRTRRRRWQRTCPQILICRDW